MKEDGLFRISIGDNPEYNDLTAEIYYKNKFVAMITQESGFDELRIDVIAPPEEENWSFLFADFVEVLERAKERLWELRKSEPPGQP